MSNLCELALSCVSVHLYIHQSGPGFSAAPVADSSRLYQTLMHGCICNHGDEGVHCTHLQPLTND